MSSENSVIESILILSAIFILVGIFIVAYLIYFNIRKARLLQENLQIREAFQQQLLRSQVEVQEATMNSLGKELHDNIGQLLGTTKLLLGVAQRNPADSAVNIKTAEDTVAKAMHELRNLSKTLNREWLEQFDFKENLLSAVNRIHNAQLVAISVNDLAGPIPLSAEHQIILFRIVQEALQNAMKHGAATRIEIEVNRAENALEISVTDNGKGFDATGTTNGVGLINMRQRVELLNGSIQWKQLQPGTAVMIHLPLHQPLDL